MVILPAIDIKDGQCVRLFKGDYSTVQKVADSYMDTAKAFESAGAEWIHMVDLDGAKDATQQNKDIFIDVAKNTGLKVEVGGGIRSLDTSSKTGLRSESTLKTAMLRQRAGWRLRTFILLSLRGK